MPLSLTVAVPPGLPRSLSAAVSGSLAVTLSYLIPADTGVGDTSVPVSYKIEVTAASSTSFVATASTSHVFSNLVKGQSYSFRVLAENPYFNGSYTASIATVALG